MGMKDMLLELRDKALQDLEAAVDPQQLQELKVKYLGRKGPMTEILRGMGKSRQRNGRKSAKWSIRSNRSWNRP